AARSPHNWHFAECKSLDGISRPALLARRPALSGRHRHFLVTAGFMGRTLVIFPSRARTLTYGTAGSFCGAAHRQDRLLAILQLPPALGIPTSRCLCAPPCRRYRTP